jgi:hypothetical protein
MRKCGEPEKKLGLMDIGGGDWRGQLNEMCNSGYLAITIILSKKPYSCDMKPKSFRGMGG